jgi:alkylation response protein AidB-like acyl-CoA dehydrogenase
MPIGIGEDHEELRRTVRRWLETRCPPEVPRALLDAEAETLPPFWGELADQGWLAIHVPEEYGGQGFGLMELAVVVEELARAAAPGPVLTTMLAAAVLAGSSDPADGKELLPQLVDGSLPAVVALPGSGSLSAVTGADGTLTLTGTVRPVLAAGAGARLLLVPAASDSSSGTGGSGAPIWCALDLDDPGVTVEPLASLDLTRRVAAVAVTGAVVAPERVLRGVTTRLVRERALTVAAAECAGGARWCLDTAAEHARTRQQFGRPIGQFQGVKHRLADMLVSVEQGVSVTWDAALALDAEGVADAGTGPGQQSRLVVPLAACLTLDGYVEAAKGAIQVLGGMGFTWEHDVHIHLRRATTLRQLAGGTAPLRAEAARLVLDGHRRTIAVDLPAEAEPLRRELATMAAAVAALDDTAAQRRALCEHGLLVPHWPAPWGREAGAVEQLVIDEALADAGIRRPNLAVAAWALPTIIAHGTPEQAERWVDPTLRGEVIWCQLFSEPGAGSDLAALSTRATRVEGGWSLSGQKVWTSVAARAHMGICLARTNPDVPKHQGITYFLVDMHSPGIEVRPLREITGAALFNEVFLDECFVPDDCVVGQVDGGWRLARTTLANERVSLSSDSAFGGGPRRRCSGALAAQPCVRTTPVTLDRAREDCWPRPSRIAQLGARATLRSLTGLQPGSGGQRAQACWEPSSSSGSTNSDSTSSWSGRGRRPTAPEAAVSSPRDPVDEPLPDHRRGDQRGAAQRHRRAHSSDCPAIPEPGQRRFDKVRRTGMLRPPR